MNIHLPSGEARTLAQAVEKRLSSDILFGRFVPDSRLRLSKLSDFYASGMSPLREALAQLVGKGLVIQDGQRGFRVAPVSPEDLQDVALTRIRLETMALRLAIEHGDEEWEADILAAHHRLTRRPRTNTLLIDELWERLHREFHFRLIAACKSARLLSFCGEIYDHFDRYRRIAVVKAGRHPSLPSGHHDIVDAVLARRTNDAMRLSAAHVENSAAEIARLLEAPKRAARAPRNGRRNGAAAVQLEKSHAGPWTARPSRRRRLSKTCRAEESQK